ncbi:hypothetical protein F5878DRAFT_729696, partial [Lentinula raphanica]
MTDFLALIRSRFLGANWPSTIAESRQKLRMKNTGAGAFDEYVSELCALNDELANTNYHFDEKQLLAIISEGLIRSFRDDLIEANLDISPTTSLKTWKEKVDEWERRSAKWKNAPRRADMYPPNEMSSNKSHGKRPSGSYVNPSSFAASSSSSAHITMDEIRSLAAKSKFTKANLPLPLTSNDRALLALIEACFKCRTAYADHDSKDPNCPGCRLDVPYRPIDMRMVEEAQRRHKKDNCAITYNALLKAVPASKPAVGAIAPRRVVDDLSELDDPPISAPAAAVVTPYGSFPVSAVIPDTALYREQPLRRYSGGYHDDYFHLPAPRAIAAVVPRDRWADYTMADSDEEGQSSASFRRIPSPPSRSIRASSPRRRVVTRSLSPGPSKKARSSVPSRAPSPERPASVANTSAATAVASVNKPLPASPPEVDYEDSFAQVRSNMPFFEPHFVWKAEIAEGSPASTPLDFLIDNGCPFVLIDANIVDSQGLKRRRLHTPHSMSLAMSDGKPQVFTASEYCKISLRDPSKLWRSKTVRALILPSLCYPMILGVPFLSHNSLVIDFAARTVIDKLSGFDLLNPSPVPLPSPSVPLPHPKLRRELRREEIVLTKRLV